MKQDLLRQKVHSTNGRPRSSQSIALFERAQNSDRILTLEDEKWYAPEDLDLEYGGELLQEAARELRERKRFIDEQAEEADAPS
ncbi:MAG TPA: hypothetical protein VJG90_02260 [Candidatus Nanoarchaeia archaeon]|nr:hypothetical protein [Candidatus Nanoarchaeia archaeon]